MAALILLLLVATVYGGALGHEFVFDDGLLVTENAVSSWPLHRAPELLWQSNEGITYRPVRMFSYMVDYAAAGGHDAWVFHLSNLLWHFAAVLLVYGFATALLGAGAPAAGLVAAAFFAVHPLGSEAVVYVAGRRDLLLGLFSTAALWLWWAFLEAGARGVGRRAALLALALLAAVLALGAKEIAVVLPVLAALLWFLRARRAGRARLGLASLGFAAAGFLLTLVVVLLYRDEFLIGLQSFTEGRGLAPQPALTLVVLGHYLTLALWPATLQADYRPFAFALPEAGLDATSMLAAIFLLAWLGAGVALLLRGRVSGVGLLWALVALAPVAQLLPYGELIAEHNAYLPLVGLGLAVGDGFSWLRQRVPLLALAFAVVLVGGCALRTWVRVPDWRDDVALWSATLETAPRAIRARHNLAVALAMRGKLLESREAFRQALDLAPGDPDVLNGLGAMEERLGEHRRAEELARKALAIRPDMDAMTLLGWSQLGQGKLDDAHESFALVLQVDPAAIEGRRGMDLVEMRLRRRRPQAESGPRP